MSEEKKIIVIEAVSKSNFGIKTAECWYNLNKKADDTTKEAAKKIIDTLGKGDQVELTLVLGSNDFLKVELKKKGENKWDDLVKFDELLADAHKKGLNRIDTDVIEINLEKKYALFKCTVEDKNGNVFDAHGDATGDNIDSEKVKKHWIRMAETRAIARALRFMTNNAKCSAEETEDPDNAVSVDDLPDAPKEDPSEAPRVK